MLMGGTKAIRQVLSLIVRRTGKTRDQPMTTIALQDREELLWGFIDAAGGVRTRCLLQDVIFLAQECNLVRQLFDYPVWPGIGTARYSEELEATLTGLLRSDKVLDTGGPATLMALVHAPASSQTAVVRLVNLLEAHDRGTLSLMAAYAMAQRRERHQGVQDPERIKEGARIRLGWPQSMVAIAEKGLQAVGQPCGE
jgi:hypothetical protein